MLIITKKDTLPCILNRALPAFCSERKQVSPELFSSVFCEVRTLLSENLFSDKNSPALPMRPN